MFRFMAFAVFIWVASISQNAYAANCFQSSIVSPSPFMGNGNEIIKLSDGSLWQDVSYKYLYLYAYYPSVIVCPSQGLMVLGDHRFRIILVGGSGTNSGGDCHDATIIRPTPFNGNGGEIIQLDDGSFWKESSYQYLYLYEYNPSVIICPSKGLMILDDNKFDVIQVR